jgi:hypothetical protein
MKRDHDGQRQKMHEPHRRKVTLVDRIQQSRDHDGDQPFERFDSPLGYAVQQVAAGDQAHRPPCRFLSR